MRHRVSGAQGLCTNGIADWSFRGTRAPRVGVGEGHVGTYRALVFTRVLSRIRDLDRANFGSLVRIDGSDNTNCDASDPPYFASKARPLLQLPVLGQRRWSCVRYDCASFLN